VDGLGTRVTAEPYRMFTSRAEYRLVLRADNADQRLTPLGQRRGCVGPGRARAFAAKIEALAAARAMVAGLRMSPTALRARGLAVNEDGVSRSVTDLLANPDLNITRLSSIWPILSSIYPAIAEQIETDSRYSGYLARQEAEIQAFRRDEALALPRDLDYAAVGSLSHEIRTKLAAAQPATLGAAARISGVTPAALAALLRYVKRREPAAA
jgi:tRNA uridine 5-carboxymethylaminomethyl modification enzyme